jgi:class 3 adenylate cyclase
MLQEGIAGAVLALFDGDGHLPRALSAAISLRDGAADGRARLALESGEVVVGARADGSAFVVGPPVGAAAMLVRGAGPGEIVVGDVAARSADSGVELRARPEGGRLLLRPGP